MSDDDFFLISSLLQDLTKINNGLSPSKTCCSNRIEFKAQVRRKRYY